MEEPAGAVGAPTESTAATEAGHGAGEEAAGTAAHPPPTPPAVEPLDAASEHEDDVVTTMTRTLSRLSIPDAPASGAGAKEAGDGGSGGAAEGEEQLPPLPSPVKSPNFSQVRACT